MKKRLLAFLLAVSIAVSMLALPASAAGNANTCPAPPLTPPMSASRCSRAG